MGGGRRARVASAGGAPPRGSGVSPLDIRRADIRRADLRSTRRRSILLLCAIAVGVVIASSPRIAAAGPRGDTPTTAAAAPPLPFAATATEIRDRGLELASPAPRAVVRISIERPLAARGPLVIRSVDGGELARATVGPGEGGRVLHLPVPMPPAGGVLPVDIELSEGETLHRARIELPPPDPEWVLWLLPAARSDPLGWLPERDAVELGGRRVPPRASAIEGVEAHLEAIGKVPGLGTTIASLPALRSFLAARPWRRDELLGAVADARLEIAAGGAGEVASPRVGLETLARAAIHGMHWRRAALGTEPRTAWPLGEAAHDPATPSFARRLGLSALVIGPAADLPGAAATGREIPSEFLWVSPDGVGILAHDAGGLAAEPGATLSLAMARGANDLPAGFSAIAELFEEHRRTSLTRQVIVPLAEDAAPPLPGLAELVAAWNATHASPRVVIGTPSRAFAAIEAEIAARGVIPPVITRDRTAADGRNASFELSVLIRSVETTLAEAERFATIAAIEGAVYPHRRLDRAWRQLFQIARAASGGGLGDQRAIELLWAARDAYEIAVSVRFAACCHLAGRVAGEGPLLWNPSAQPRVGHWVADDIQDGRRTSLELSLPPLGVRRTGERPSGEPTASTASTASTSDGSRPVLVNEHLRVELDLSLGGALVSIIDRATGDELLDGPGNDLVVTDIGSGDDGAERPGTGVEARLIAPDRDRPHRIELEARYGEFTKRQTIELLPGTRRIDFETQILRYRGRDQILSVVFPLRHPGARPVHATASAAIGCPAASGGGARAFGEAGDRPCGAWVALGRVAAIEVVPGDGPPLRRAFGAGEVVIAASAGATRQEQANQVVRALVALGVTTTISREGERGEGDPAPGSAGVDFRLFIGGGEELAGVAALEAAGLPADDGGGCRYVEPGSDVPGVDLPTIVLSAQPVALRRFLASLVRDRAVVLPAEATRLGPAPSVADRGIALVPQGAGSCRVGADGTIALHLLQSSTEWPSGEWADAPARAQPSGAPFGTMHGSHRFRYSLIPHDGDHVDAELAARADEVLHPPLRQLYRSGDGSIEDGRSWLSVGPASVLVTAFEPAGEDLARLADEPGEAVRAVAVRIWNAAGSPVEATIRPGFAVVRAETTDLLETSAQELPLDAVRGIRVPLAPWEVRTVRLALEVRETPPVALDLPPADITPNAPWLEGRGEGAENGVAFALAARERDLVLGPAGGETTLGVLNLHRSRTITVPLTVRSPAALDVSLDPPQAILAPGAYADIRLAIVPREPWRGRALVEIVAALPEGAVAAAVWVRDPGTPADSPAVEIVSGPLLVPPRGELRAIVRNLTEGPLRGELAWISPRSAWDSIPRWRQELELPPRGEAPVAVRLSSPIDGFAIPRFAAGGGATYGESVALLENASYPLLSFDVGRVRISESGLGVANLSLRGLRGLSAESEIGLRAPEGWRVEEIARAFTPAAAEGGELRLDVSLAIALEDGSAAGPIVAAGPGGGRASVETARVPVARARAAGAAVAIDGDLSEWDDSEFVAAEGGGGAFRVAARHDPEGLVLAFAVEDDVHRPARSGAATGEGDLLRIGITPSPRSAIGPSPEDLELVVAETPLGPQVWCARAGAGGQPGPLPESPAIIRAATSAGGTAELRGEVRLPRDRLPGIVLAPGAVLGFAVAWLDDDGAGAVAGRERDRATEWSGGLLGARDPSRYGELRLIE